MSKVVYCNLSPSLSDINFDYVYYTLHFIIDTPQTARNLIICCIWPCNTWRTCLATVTNLTNPFTRWQTTALALETFAGFSKRAPYHFFLKTSSSTSYLSKVNSPSQKLSQKNQQKTSPKNYTIHGRHLTTDLSNSSSISSSISDMVSAS